MKSFIRVLVTVVLVIPGIMRAQPAQRVHVSNDDPKWGDTITITYTAPDTSIFAHPGPLDTLFTAVNVSGSRPERAIVQPMRHLRDSLYESSIVIPDSTSSLWVEVAIPTDRLPDGITVFTCRTRENKPAPGALLDVTTNVDSAVTADLAIYPKHYSAFVSGYDKAQEYVQGGALKMSSTDFRLMTASMIARLQQSPDSVPSWQLALAGLYHRSGRDSLAQVALHNAAANGTYDPIVNERDFWSSFFAPVMTKSGGIAFPQEPGRIIAPLVQRYPRSMMAKDWIRSMAYDSLLPVGTWRQVTTSWATSHDVDVLASIAAGYGNPKGPAYQPELALLWVNRAEENWRTRAGFYSGENIYGSMGRLGRILAMKVRLLAATGKLDEAVTVATAGIQMVHETHEKQDIGAALAKACLTAGRIDDAKRAYGRALALSTHSRVDGIDELYQKCKEGNESMKEFTARLAATYGKDVELPPIPDFSFTTLDGMHGSLAALRGKVVVLDCWFISCPGCAVEHNSLNRLVDSFHGDTNVVFLSIALDDEAALARNAQRTESKFKIVPNGDAICAKLGVTGYPTHIIISRDGKTLGYELGGSESEGEAMRPKVEQALAGS